MWSEWSESDAPNRVTPPPDSLQTLPDLWGLRGKFPRKRPDSLLKVRGTIHAGQPVDSGLAMLGRRSWQAIRRVAGIECPEPVEGLSFVYLLQTEDGTFYTGQSHNVRERLRKHRLGLASKYPGCRVTCDIARR